MSTSIPLEATSRFVVDIIRTAAGDWIDGVFVNGAQTTFQIVANVQPLTADELINLEEAQRTRETLKLYTRTTLLSAQESPSEVADQLSFDGKQYQIQQVYRYKGQHLRHNKAICVRFIAP